MVGGVKPPDPTQLNKDVATLAGDSGGGGGGSLFGANSTVLDSAFDVSGLAGLLPSKNKYGTHNDPTFTGRELLQSFLAAGQSDDPTTRNMVAAVEYALYQSNYYSSSAAPNLYEVTGEDAAALGRALSDLAQVNQTAAGATPNGEVKRMGLGQFLTSQAALAAAGGPGAPGAAVKKAKPVKLPNPAEVAAAYRRVATGIEGERPTQAETSTFVNQYMQQFQQQAGQADPYRQQVAQALNQQANGQASTPPVGSVPAPPQNLPHGITAVDPNTGVDPGAPPAPGMDLSSSMQTLNDVLAQYTAANQAQAQVAPESLQTQAEDFARNSNPKAAARESLGNTMNNFFQIIKGIGQ